MGTYIAEYDVIGIIVKDAEIKVIIKMGPLYEFWEI